MEGKTFKLWSCFHTKCFCSPRKWKIIAQKRIYNKLPSLLCLRLPVLAIINRYFWFLESNRTQIMDINTYRWSRFLSLPPFVSKVLFVCNKLISTMWYRFRWPLKWFSICCHFLRRSPNEHKNVNICFPFLLILPTCFCINVEYKLKQMLTRENKTSFSSSITEYLAFGSFSLEVCAASATTSSFPATF